MDPSPLLPSSQKGPVVHVNPQIEPVLANERVYQMTRVKDGDYILPSNDATVLWRISKYQEDGSLERGDGTIVKGTFWSIAHFRDGVTRANILLERGDTEEFFAWDQWETVETLLKTRADAVKAALRIKP